MIAVCGLWFMVCVGTGRGLERQWKSRCGGGESVW